MTNEISTLKVSNGCNQYLSVRSVRSLILARVGEKTPDIDDSPNSELDGIAEQVVEQLAQAVRVRCQHREGRMRRGQMQAQRLLLRLGRNGLQRLRADRRNIARHPLWPEGAIGQAREIQCAP